MKCSLHHVGAAEDRGKAMARGCLLSCSLCTGASGSQNGVQVTSHTLDVHLSGESTPSLRRVAGA